MRNKWLHPTAALKRQFELADETPAQTTLVDEVQTVRRLGFKMGDVGLLISSDAISELTDLLPICPIPNTPAHLLGLVNLRGNLTPVFDLHYLLKVKSNKSSKTMLLVLGRGADAAGVLIDDLPAHQFLSPQEKLAGLPQVPDIVKPYISSGYKQQNTIWLSFDYQSFFQSLV
jgi:chemotaxis signal transduction protein